MTAYAYNTLAATARYADALERGLVHTERADDAAIRSEILAALTRLARGPVPAGQAAGAAAELFSRAAGIFLPRAGGRFAQP